MNKRKIFSALFVAIAMLASSVAFSGGVVCQKRGPYDNHCEEHGQKQSASQSESGSNNAPKVANNSQLHPYMPQRGVVEIYKSQSYCDFNGNHTSRSIQSEYSCVDFKSKNRLWRVVFGPGINRGTIARRIFEREDNDWVMLAEFDDETRLVAESPSGTKVRLASGTRGHNEPQQANGRGNSSPIKGIPDVGGIPIGTILNGILNKGR